MTRALGHLPDVLSDIDDELKRQIMLFGEGPRASLEWLVLVTEELGEVARHVNVLDVPPVFVFGATRDTLVAEQYVELVQTLALLVRWAAQVKAEIT